MKPHCSDSRTALRAARSPPRRWPASGLRRGPVAPASRGSSGSPRRAPRAPGRRPSPLRPRRPGPGRARTCPPRAPRALRPRPPHRSRPCHCQCTRARPRPPLPHPPKLLVGERRRRAVLRFDRQPPTFEVDPRDRGVAPDEDRDVVGQGARGQRAHLEVLHCPGPNWAFSPMKPVGAEHIWTRTRRSRRGPARTRSWMDYSCLELTLEKVRGYHVKAKDIYWTLH